MRTVKLHLHLYKCCIRKNEIRSYHLYSEQTAFSTPARVSGTHYSHPLAPHSYYSKISPPSVGSGGALPSVRPTIPLTAGSDSYLGKLGWGRRPGSSMLLALTRPQLKLRRIADHRRGNRRILTSIAIESPLLLRRERLLGQETYLGTKACKIGISGSQTFI